MNLLYEDLFSQGKLFPPNEAMCQIQVLLLFSNPICDVVLSSSAAAH